MSNKRRDNKNRVLQNGESQRADGRYRYKYTDINGKEQNIYSWKLVSTDKVPAGKRDCEALRDMKKTIQSNKEWGIVSNGGNMTVYELCEKYILTKTNVKENTQAVHKTSMNIIKKEPFGAIRIDKVRVLDAKTFLIKLQQEDQRSYGSIQEIRGILRPAFQLAVESDYIKRNPFDFFVKDVLVNDTKVRQSLSVEEEKSFLDFIKKDKRFVKYYDAIYVLFKTGLRISEFCGLTLSDINIKDRTINVDHQLQRKRNGSLYVLEDNEAHTKTKTQSGTRCVPMLTDEVFLAFKNLIRNRNTPKCEPMVDGYCGFLMIKNTKMGKTRPFVSMDWEYVFDKIWREYNKTHNVVLPKVTPHVCRHTFCNNMANLGMNPVHLQYYMGHANIAVTMRNYVHTKTDDAKHEGERLLKEGKLVNFI